jgi:hypothetical protein
MTVIHAPNFFMTLGITPVFQLLCLIMLNQADLTLECHGDVKTKMKTKINPNQKDTPLFL